MLKVYTSPQHGAGPEYRKKEDLRKELEEEILTLVALGEIWDQDSLDAFLADVDSPIYNLAVTALRSVPFSVWKRLAPTMGRTG